MAARTYEQEDMVGQREQYMNIDEKIKFSEVVSKYIDKGYELGSWGPDSYDCMSFIYSFYKDLNVDLKDSYQGVTKNSYVDIYRNDEIRAKSLLREWFDSLGEEVDINYSIPGDLILVDKEGLFAVLINIGNGNFMGVHTPKGVITLPRRALNTKGRNVSCRRLYR